MIIRRLLHPSPADLISRDAAGLGWCAVAAAVGFALYGLTVGFWRSPLMGGYVAVKMPLLIVLTLGCNGVLNGLLGILLGSGLGFRQSLHALLGAFAISALILGSLAPVTLFLALNAPPPDSPQAGASHSAYLLAHTLLVAVAGLAGVLRLGGLLARHSGSRRIARTTLVAWIAGNAFLGAQFSWILRPFFGSPSLEVAFLRPDPMRGNFYETVWRAAGRTLAAVGIEPLALIAPAAIGALFFLAYLRTRRHRRQPPKP